MPSLGRLSLLLALASLAGLSLLDTDTMLLAKAEAAPPLRRPLALVISANGKSLYVANRSGSISILDIHNHRLLSEKKVGLRLADLALLSDGRLLAVDQGAQELLVLSAQLQVQHRVQVPAPVSVHATPDGRRCSVASLWGRQLTLLDLTGSKPHVTHSIPLPFAPRRQLLLAPEGKLLVADAFGSRLALVHLASGEVESVREMAGHNIAGLAVTAGGKEVLIAHQVLSRLARTTFDDIHWGNLLANYLRVIPRGEILKPQADLVRGSRLLPVGDFGHGTGDPEAMVVAPDGTLVLALAGVGEIGIGPAVEGRLRYTRVGRRPTAVTLSSDGRTAFVANTFDDAISVVDMTERKSLATIALGKSRELTSAERGELLFHDARLTHDGWFSCHSCHTDGHTNGQLADTQGDGSYGASKRVPTLLGVKDTGPWAWNGQMKTLESQIRQSIETTMHGRKPTDAQVRDLTAYLETLSPPPPVLQNKNAAIERGGRLFETRGCVNCHARPNYTTPRTYDVGLVDEVGNKEFNPPSLRGVSQGGPYFHDGRATTLEDVLVRDRHQIKSKLSEEELKDLLSYLRSL